MNPSDSFGADRHAARRRPEDRSNHHGTVAVIDVFAGDLPCPWCGEATSEADASCRGCGRNFG